MITAADGELYHDANGVERYLGLNDGFRVEGVIGQDNYRLMRYQRNDIKLPDNDSDTNADSVKRSAPTTVLLASNDPVQRAELQWRLAAPMSVLVLVLLALPLAKSQPARAALCASADRVAGVVRLLQLPGASAARWISQGVLDPRIGFLVGADSDCADRAVSAVEQPAAAASRAQRAPLRGEGAR